MILTAHQPVYLPWLGLFHKISLADTFVTFNQVQYLPRDWNNRNKIRTYSGDIWLTVPVLKSGHRRKTISQIKINNSEPWQRKHWKSIYLNYKKAPYFDKYIPFFEEVYRKKWELLTDLNEYMLKYFLNILGIRTKYLNASDFSFEGRKNELVLDMCKKLNAKLYIFGSLGKDYADLDSFKKEDIKVYFQDYKHPVYSQLFNKPFSSNLSIIDLIFNHGNSSYEILMSGNINKNRLEKEDTIESTCSSSSSR